MSGRYEVRHMLIGEYVKVYILDTSTDKTVFTYDYYWGLEVTCPNWYYKIRGFTFEKLMNIAITKMQNKADYMNEQDEIGVTKAERVKKAYERMFGKVSDLDNEGGHNEST